MDFDLDFDLNDENAESEVSPFEFKNDTPYLKVDIKLEANQTDHFIYDNASCLILEGSTSTLYIC